MMSGLKDASHLYEVEKRARYGERPGFKITELHISPTQKVPWHTHTNVRDSFYVIAGSLQLFMMDPKENVVLKAGDFYSVVAGRPHLVTNAGSTLAQFLVIGDSQGTGDYDFVPFVPSAGDAANR
jgi:quercetin dioxygenase-like cupin family protein